MLHILTKTLCTSCQKAVHVQVMSGQCVDIAVHTDKYLTLQQSACTILNALLCN